MDSALVIGEAFIDLIAQSDGNETTYLPKFGGSPLNVAVGVRRLGTPVHLAATLTPGAFGDALEAFCSNEGIDIRTLSSPVEQGFISVATPRDGRVSYEYYGPLSSLTSITRIDEAHVRAATVVHSSSTALLADPARATVREAFAGAQGFRTLDPNPRPTLIDDMSDYLAGLESIYPHIDLLKASDEDLELIAPGWAPQATALRLHRAHQLTVIVTRAAAPTLLIWGDRVSEIEVPPAEVLDATGAGDSFMASVLADVAQHGTPADRDRWARYVQRANQAAAATCRGRGGAESMPTAASLDRGEP